MTFNPPMDDSAPLVELRGITKRFGSVLANDQVDLSLAPGEVLGLLGENGAGKTTLMNILFGLYGADSGSIVLSGRAVSFQSPADALAQGIGMVHQHFHLVPRHSVLENLMVGQPGFRLRRAEARARLADLGGRYGIGLEPDRIVGTLSVGEQQRLEIIKALFGGARILILDEPTSVLTPQESEGLFSAIRAMAETGFGVIFISHKLREVRAITNRIAIMRQGRMAAVLENDEALDNRRLAELMCGHELSPPAKEPGTPGKVLLRVEGVHTSARGGGGELKGVDLELREGEILGVAGVSGNGQGRLAEVVTGVVAPSSGTIGIHGQEVADPSPGRMRRLGVAAIPEDRIGEGFLAGLPLSDTMILPHIRHQPYSHLGLLDLGAIREFATAEIGKYSIRTTGPGARSATLSGGNQQRAILARELAGDPSILVAAQPTRGLDVAGREFVHTLFLGLRRSGKAVLVISEDLEELFEITDRIAVMYEGRIAGLLPTAEADAAKIGLLMAGVSEAA